MLEAIATILIVLSLLYWIIKLDMEERRNERNRETKNKE